MAEHQNSIDGPGAQARRTGFDDLVEAVSVIEAPPLKSVDVPLLAAQLWTAGWRAARSAGRAVPHFVHADGTEISPREADQVWGGALEEQQSPFGHTAQTEAIRTTENLYKQGVLDHEPTDEDRAFYTERVTEGARTLELSSDGMTRGQVQVLRDFRRGLLDLGQAQEVLAAQQPDPAGRVGGTRPGLSLADQHRAAGGATGPRPSAPPFAPAPQVAGREGIGRG